MQSTPEKCNKPRVAITMGDPCGIGPEILVKAFQEGDLRTFCTPLVIGEPLALQRAVALLRADLHVTLLNGIEDLEDRPDTIPVISPHTLHEDEIRYGEPTAPACGAVVQYIEQAAQLALTEKVQAICTCPIHKAQLQRHGFAFPGHTEFLQHLTRARDVVMMLAGPKLRVALVTIHHALAEVPALLTRERLSTTIRITAQALRQDFALQLPRLAVAALNPHAGENGRFGREEIEIMQPVIQSLPSGRCQVSGPYSADTLFYRAYQGEFDAVIAIYHDQGLIPIKLVHFHDAVNVSLGLPIIRTSVDHGTAYDLAGSGTAHAGSLLAAIRLAARMAGNRRKLLDQAS